MEFESRVLVLMQENVITNAVILTTNFDLPNDKVKILPQYIGQYPSTTH